MSETNGVHFTPTQKKMLQVLSDGKGHTKEELHACCGPSSPMNVNNHLMFLRKKLRPIGQDVICVLDGISPRPVYQHVRLLVYKP